MPSTNNDNSLEWMWVESSWRLSGTKLHRPAFFPSFHSNFAIFFDFPKLYTFFIFYQNVPTNIMAQNTHMLSVTMGDGNVHSGNITSSFNSYVYKSDQDAEIMRWLSPLEPHNRHQSVRTERFGGVGGWLLEVKEFREWRSGEGAAENAVLFCSGNPGVGKTYLR